MPNLRQIELRQLLVLEALLAERNVTRAARKLGLTQPAVSNALARLRILLKDKLFIRGAGGIMPTPFALQLSEPLHAALRELEEAIQPPRFVAAEASLTFRLAMSSHAELTILPLIAARLHRLAPKACLHVRPKSTPEVPPQLDTRDLDFAIGASVLPAKRFSSVDLYADEYVCVMRKDHPLARGQFDLRDFAAAPQLQISATGATNNLLDDLLFRRRLRREVVTTVNHFLAGLRIVAETELVTGMFLRTLLTFKEFDRWGLTYRRLKKLDPVTMTLVWRPDLRMHPAYAWLREQIYEVCAPFRVAVTREPGRAKNRR
jgi:DNA-binding transcriptional LysR family regulator